MRGYCLPSASISSPAFKPDTNKAPSIGSPWTSHSSFLCSSEASLQSTAARITSSNSGLSSGSTSLLDSDIAPWGSYPVPPSSNRFPAVAIVRTVISLRVRVPVLSEQMTDTAPSVSTAGSLRIMALRQAIRCTPMASVMVIIAGSPSGIAATARLTAARNISAMA